MPNVRSDLGPLAVAISSVSRPRNHRDATGYSVPLKELQCPSYDRTSERGMDRPSIDRCLQLNRHEISYATAVAPIAMLSFDVLQLWAFEIGQSHPAKCKDSYRHASTSDSGSD
jgi:hypothetical protein